MPVKLLRLLCLLCFLVWGSRQVLAQKIILPAGIVTFRLPPDDSVNQELLKSISFKNRYYFAAFFSKLPDATALRKMNEEGSFLSERLAPNTFLIDSRVNPDANWCRQYQISGITPLPPGLKTDYRITNSNIPIYALAAKDFPKIMVGVYGNPEMAAVRNVLIENGFIPTNEKWIEKGIFIGNAPLNAISAIEKLPFVYAIRLQNPEDKTLNNIGRGASGTALLNAPVLQGGRGLLGEGVTVGVGDNSDPTLHPDIRDRVLNHTPGIPNDHGAHVTGTVAGAGILNYSRAGFAPKARIVSQWFSGVWENAATYTQSYNMVVTNNSYGSITGDCVYAGVYDLYSRMLDLQAVDYPQLLHAFAAGNDGDNTCTPYPQAYHTVLGGYQSAKNIITVGRTDYTQVSSGSSSSGPVRDGRLKPEITGIGIINSLNGTGNGYFVDFGTSMSSPNIAGGLALLVERYRQLNGGANPQGNLMKAILLNGARDVGTKGPDFRHGYGTMMLERSLRILENKQFLQRSIAQAQVQDSVITVPANTRQLKVMLYWHDPAANVLAANTLVHDLDLEIIAPGNTVILPSILDPSAAGVKNAATPGADHTNNQEQVIIDNPTPGNYTIRIKGTEVLTQPQQTYAIAFDYVPNELRFTNPVKGSMVQAENVGFPVAWEDEGNGSGLYKLEYSLDNGGNWTVIVNDLKDTTRLYFWEPGSIRSPTAKLRLTKGTNIITSETFAVIPNLTFSAAVANDQCFGYFRINFAPLTPTGGETIDYLVKLKKGSAMETVAEVSGQNFYTIGNLHPDSTYYAAIVARINGVEGGYNTAITRRPNTGNCNGSISDGNLMLDSIIAPLSGRVLTSLALTSNSAVSVRIRNLDNVATTTFSVKYNINGGAFTETTLNTPVAARGTFTHTFPPVDFSATGVYNITAIVTNTGAADPMAANDTFRVTIRQLPNEPLSLAVPFEDDFETAESAVTLKSETGLAGLTRWDYKNADLLARARTFVTPDIPRTGVRAITLDVSKAPPRIVNPFNQLMGTFNLQNFSVNNHEIRLAFYFKHHGFTQVVHPLNKVWVRGNDTNDWLEIFDLGVAQTLSPGEWKLVTGLDLNGVLKAGGQQFSSSTQVRFGQYAQYSMADNKNFGGYSFDDVSLFIGQNDVQVMNILSPAEDNCGAGMDLPVKIKVRNNMPAALNNIPVRYRINGGAWVEEILATLGAKSETDFTFSTMANLPGFGIILLEVETNYATDNIPGNNKVQVNLIGRPVVTTFPYYQDFEAGNGDFVAHGLNSSWEFGTPASLRVKTAASGSKAWKTTLIGDYKNLEKSYLYTPCFNISSLANPMLSFSLAYSIEDCRSGGFICDAAWMEYSLDGLTWQKLGSFGQGESWYDYETGQVWMAANQTNWREAIIPLPVHNGTIRLRYVFSSDDGSTREGMAIDNFHVYNGGALPIEWIRFEAGVNNANEVTLNWKVANPKPAEYFDVQVSTDPNTPNNFVSLGSVSVAGSAENNFRFTDKNPGKSGTLFYRIVWQRQNALQSVSPVRKVKLLGSPDELMVYPNPAGSSLLVRAEVGNNGPCNIRILAADGKQLFATTALAVNGQLNLPVNLTPLRLSAGVYFLEMTHAKGRQTIRWIKQ